MAPARRNRVQIGNVFPDIHAMNSLPFSPPPPTRTRHPLRILYADDCAELRDFMRILLPKAGHLVETAPDGHAALQWLRRAGAAIDLLITDHQMPGLNGLELVRLAQATPFAGPVVVYSSCLDPLVAEQYRQLGVALILAKPVPAATLHQKLDALFHEPRRFRPRHPDGPADGLAVA